MRPLYLAIVILGNCDDTYHHIVFGSLDKNKVEKWVNKFNKLITSNRARMHNFDIENEIVPFWYDMIMYESPFARIEENKLK
ncbi:MAG: hypothetical protein PF569_01820 [Candidatus Woesearchaeota archaeon]|jgi:hypothetical protein|nr:hypothetical protein [Candidatus Woesearchaeota archaeon]